MRVCRSDDPPRPDSDAIVRATLKCVRNLGGSPALIGLNVDQKGNNDHMGIDSGEERLIDGFFMPFDSVLAH